MRVTASVLDLPLSEAVVKLMSAGRKDSASLLEETEPEAGVSIRVWETGRFSGVELRRDLRVCDEVEDERETEPVWAG